MSTLVEYCAPIISSQPAVRAIRDFSEIDPLLPAWNSWRGHRDANSDVYQTLLAAGSSTARPYIIAIERGGRFDALLLGSLTTGTVTAHLAYFKTSLKNVRILNFVYGGFLGNQSEENSELMVDHVVDALWRGEADIARLNYLSTESPLHHHATRKPSWGMREHFSEIQLHSVMELPQTVEAMYAGLSGEHRWKLRRDSKKIQSAFPNQLRIVRYDRPDEMAELIERTEEVAAKTYQRGLGVGFSKSPEIRELLELEARKGWLRGHVLYIGGRSCAFWIGCLYNGIFLSEYLAYDPAYSKYSPGNYLMAHVMEELCREGVRKIDFGIGDSLYKQRFGNSQWQESALYLYASTVKGIQAKALRTTAALATKTAKAVLKRTTLVQRLKTLWRKRLGQTKPSGATA